MADHASTAMAAPGTGVPACTIGDVIRRQARERGDATALVFGERRLTYACLDRRTDRIAHALLAAGLKQGDRLAYLGKNSDRHFELLVAAAKARLVLVPLNWRLARPELEFQIDDAAPRILFAGPEFLHAAKDLAADRGMAVIAAEVEQGDVPGFEDWLAARSGAASGATPLPVAEPDDVVLIMYTSGTTGRPKGAMLSHRSLLRVADGAPLVEPDFFIWRPGEVALIAMPTFHVGGTGQGLRALKGGATAVILKEFSVDAVLEAVVAHRVDKLFLVPSAIHAVLQHPSIGTADYSCLRYILYGASPIPADLLRTAMAAFGCGFVQMYGATETSGTITALSPEDHLSDDPARLTSAGAPLPGVEIVILDDNGVSLPAGEPGEIAVRSVANMAGYWQLPVETAGTVDAQGWLRTGDVGRLDADGYLTVFDRVKDMIISGGENVYPAEVENAIFSHPAVQDVAAIGLPDPRWGEKVTAIVVRQPGQNVDADAIIAWARGRIAAFKVPKAVHFVDALPRNPSGKILRRELRDRFAASTEAS
ncbi:MAG: long-chain-fatty-acid--CoA ligase [Novosphingobium sp.]